MLPSAGGHLGSHKAHQAGNQMSYPIQWKTKGCQFDNFAIIGGTTYGTTNDDKVVKLMNIFFSVIFFQVHDDITK